MSPTLTGYRQLDNSLRPPRRGARITGPVDPNETVVLSIVVRRKPGAPALPDHQYWMSVPPGRRKFPSRSEFAAKYGAASNDLDAVAQFCRNQGLTVLDSSAARRCVVASGTAAVVAQAFHVELMRYTTANETYRGHEGYVQLPSEIADLVDGVLGFDNRRLGTHASNGGGPYDATPLTPIQVAQFYQFPRFTTGGNQLKDATGQTIGILEFGGVNTGTNTKSPVLDCQQYFTSLGITNPAQVITVPSNQTEYGGTMQGNMPNRADTEVVLDVEVAGAIAQGAKIVVYFGTGFSSTGPNEQGWHALVSTATTDDTNKPTVLSISWGAAESEWPDGAIAMITPLFQAAAAAGITVFVASGDYGASGYNPNDQNMQDGAHVIYPASDPYVTACGGTTIVSSPPPWVQFTWNDSAPPYNGGATGGGFGAISNVTAPRPPWQSNVTYNGQPLPGRGVPDVAGNASAYSGYQLILYGQTTAVLNMTYPMLIASAYAGTSAAAPLYAGLIALINSNLFPSNITTQTSVGFLNPTLYGLEPDAVNFVFQNINDGGNNDYNGVAGYQSVAGWNPCTGWGSINGGQLLEIILLGYVSENPGCMAALRAFARALMGSGG